MHCHHAGLFPRLVPSFVAVLMVAAVAWLVGGVHAADGTSGSRRILVCGGRTAIVDITPDHPEGVVEWSWPAGTREGWVLPDGNVLLALSKGVSTPKGAAVEIKRGAAGAADEIVWRYDGTQEEVNSIQKTPDGTYVLTEAGPNPRLLEIAADGSVKVEFPLACQKHNAHIDTHVPGDVKNQQLALYGDQSG